MATTPNYVKPIFGEQIFIEIGDGASPEVFSAPNLINTTRGFSFSTSSESEEIVDMNNQSAPAQTVRRIKATDLKIDGAGVIDRADLFSYIQWNIAGVVKNVRIRTAEFTITGSMVMSSFQITGDRLKSATCQITLEQAGPMTVAAVA